MAITDTIKDLLRPVYRAYLTHRHHGNEVTCNICGKSFSSFRPIFGRHADGTVYKIENREGTCWQCSSYPRMRQLWYWLENTYKIGERKGISILHVAPETSVSQRIRNISDINYTCIDKRCAGYRYPSFVKDGDVCNLNFESEQFDLVICNHVLEHIKDDRRAMSEIYRVLRKGGIALLLVPMDMSRSVTEEEAPDETLTPQQREDRFGQYDHVRIYGTDYFSRLRDSGFNVDRVTYDTDLTKKLGFIPSEEVIVCHKL